MNCRAQKTTLHLLVTALVVTFVGCSSGEASSQEKQAATADTQQGKESGQHKQYPANRLAQETSPYLLMHAHNPVDWYPWGDEAFAKAKKENKLIFLSIGYSSCHWCHVMEKESFMDEEIAKYLNEHFVCVKVDREERPDVDEIYMTSLQVYMQLTTGRSGGGWPLSMFLTPDGLPLAGGTYFPPRAQPGMRAPGFLSVIEQMNKAWSDDNETALSNGKIIADIVKKQLDGSGADAVNSLSPQATAAVYDSLTFNFDPDHGGFNYNPVNPRVPKFPSPSNLLFLVDEIRSLSDGEATDESNERLSKAQTMLLSTLDHMAAGGIYDHLGGGFHRYSVDRYWDVPHFEKMLYDNGQLATVYAETFALTDESRYRRIVEESLNFVLREMTDEQGGFYSALDADSEGEEGTFYIWSKNDVEEILAGMDQELFSQIYSLDAEPNFEGKHYVLRLSSPLKEISESKELTVPELWERIRPMQAKLMASRDLRERPLTDTKILTAWNGLMIRGFADAGRILEKQEYVNAAARAANFLLTHVKTSEGRLLRTYSAGEAKLNAYLDDYAYFVEGLIALHRATGEQRWLDEADALTNKQIELFGDDNRGGFFYTSEDHEALIARSKGRADNVRPGGNSVAASNLVYLADQLNKPKYLDRALATLQSYSATFSGAPAALPRMAIVLRELAKRGMIVEPPVEKQQDVADQGTGDGIAPPTGSGDGDKGKELAGITP
ncbi:MAG: thioredoxin domain-containing protein [Pirellulales bacterium]|nr:thioredoxin domain-containing protein [Pirellulales bacterium]